MSTKVHLQVITSSAAKTFRACPRMYKIKYILGYRSAKVAEVLRIGTAFHKCLEAWWCARRDGLDRMDAVLAVVEQLEDAFDRERCLYLMLAYEVRWGALDLEVLAVELAYSVPLVNPDTGCESRTWLHRGKLDVLVRDRASGYVWLMEHKSTSEEIGAGAEYWQRLKIDNQISQYLAASTALGYDPAGCIYDVIKKPGIRPLQATPVESRKYKKGTNELYANQRDHDEQPSEFGERLEAAIMEAPGRYLARGEVVNLEHDRREAAADLWMTAKMIRESELRDFWPRNPDACKRWGRTCDFFPVCVGEAQLADQTMYRKVDDVHEELKDETQSG